MRIYALAVMLLCALLASCRSSHDYMYTESGKYRGHYKVGNPYKIQDKWYTPKVETDYDKVGIASWYGPNFHGKLTANGEIFDEDALTAAHKTLPIPSMVQVTNMENGRTLIVRVNDRGPYSKGRIIDMSKKSAELLGFKNQGTAKVRVQFLPGHTKRLLADLKLDNSLDAQFASAEPVVNFTKEDLEQQVDVLPLPVVRETNVVAPVGTGVAVVTPANPRGIMLTGAETTEEMATTLASLQQDIAKVKQKTDITENSNSYIVGDDLFIQAGAFGVEKNASRIAHQLLSFGEPRIDPIKVDNQLLYRVRLGPINNRQEAEQILTQLVDAGHSSAKIVID